MADPAMTPSSAQGRSGWARFEDVVLLNLSTLALIVCGAIMLVEMIARSAFDVSMGWADEVSREAMLFAFFLSMGCAHRHAHFIRSGMFVDRLSPRARRIFDRLGALCGVAFSLTLLVTGIARVLRLHRLGTVTESSLETPVWLIGLLLPIGACALLIYFIGALRRSLAGAHPFEQSDGELL